MGRLSFVLPLLALGFVTTIALAQSGEADAGNVTFSILHSFSGGDGGAPYAALIQAANGELYGTTYGGSYSAGTVFKITTSGTLTTLHHFCAQVGCTDGEQPLAGLVQAANGDLYGTTRFGGVDAYYGTVFKISPSGTLTTLYSFCTQSGCPDGGNPEAGLVQAANGDLYGTTYGGYYVYPTVSYGTVFKITPTGTLTTLYSFCLQANCAYAEYPEAGLVQAANGHLYGTTWGGGANGDGGTIFEISPNGSLSTVYSFCALDECPNGERPQAALIQATNEDLYGTTEYGGANGLGAVFKITPSGTLTLLYSFCGQPNCADGYFSGAGVIQANDGDFYGITTSGGAYGGGTVFKITPSGALTTLYSFCTQPECTDGKFPNGGLVQDTNGNFYGTTYDGGANGDGTVFRLSLGLKPFVKIQPTSGKVGETVKILGTDLTGATSVTFNGTPAVFTIKSPTEITTTVPAGATTGKVEVITPEGTLSSNVAFRIP